MNKIKFFSFIIAIEVVVIVVLSILFFTESLTTQSNSKKIIFNEEIIYTKGTDIPFTGRMLDTLENKLIVEFNVVNGFKQGEFYLSKMDGSCAVLGHMNKNKNDGAWKYFYDCGQLECAGSFTNDEPSGKWIWYYKNGLVKCEGNYINGKPVGQWIKYDQTGNTSTVVNYQFGEVVSYLQLNTPTNI